MEAKIDVAPVPRKPAARVRRMIRERLARVPLIGWLFGMLAAALIEYFFGLPLARALGLSKVPLLFGTDVISLILKSPGALLSTLVYVVLVYIAPTLLVAAFTHSLANRLAEILLRLPGGASLLVHLGVFYAAIHIWSGLNVYRVLILKLMLIAVMATLSLNVINGYMGEFSCSHPGFLAIGAYTSSVLTVLLFVNDDVFGAPLLPPAIGPFLFPLVLIIGGILAAVGALAVAIPSFRTRGDYLAIISLAFMFIVKSSIENMEIIGGPRGFMNQPDWASLPAVFIWAVVCVWVVNNFVRSILGKALNAVRDDEVAANAMTVNTRKTKMVAFLFAAFWAGVAGGLLAHVMRYVNPGTFGVQKLAEVLAMLYFGGLNSVVGSVVGAVGFTLFSEALRPLEIYKWIIIPVLLILVMMFRPTGLLAFKELDPSKIVEPRRKPEREVEHTIASD